MIFLISRHRKTHDRPYECLLCRGAFALKTDLKRHKQIHRRRVIRFSCKVPKCTFKTHMRKEILKEHMRRSHIDRENSIYSEDALWSYYEAAVKNEELYPLDESKVAFLEAASQGNELMFKNLLSLNIDPLSADERRGYTAACYAAMKGNLKILQLLVNAGVSIIDCARVPGRGKVLYPLNLALENGHLAPAEYMIRYGAEKMSAARISCAVPEGDLYQVCEETIRHMRQICMAAPKIGLTKLSIELLRLKKSPCVELLVKLVQYSRSAAHSHDDEVEYLRECLGAAIREGYMEAAKMLMHHEAVLCNCGECYSPHRNECISSSVLTEAVKNGYQALVDLAVEHENENFLEKNWEESLRFQNHSPFCR